MWIVLKTIFLLVATDQPAEEWGLQVQAAPTILQSQDEQNCRLSCWPVAMLIMEAQMNI